MRIKALVVALLMAISSAYPSSGVEQLPPKVAVAYDIGFLGDNSFNDSVHLALKLRRKSIH